MWEPEHLVAFYDLLYAPLGTMYLTVLGIKIVWKMSG
jgi:hypothetical protein